MQNPYSGLPVESRPTPETYDMCKKRHKRFLRERFPDKDYLERKEIAALLRLSVQRTMDYVRRYECKQLAAGKKMLTSIDEVARLLTILEMRGKESP